MQHTMGLAFSVDWIPFVGINNKYMVFNYVQIDNMYCMSTNFFIWKKNVPRVSSYS